MYKFIHATDFHIKASNPVSRIDNYPETCKRKIRWLVEKANELECDILITGDIVDTPDTSPSLIGDITEILRELNGECFYILGNHDVYGYNCKTYARTPLRIADAAGVITKVEDNEVIPRCNVVITGKNYHIDMDTPEHISDYSSHAYAHKDAVRIHMVHGFVTEKPWPHVATTLMNDVFESTNATIVLTGHEHIGFGIVEQSGKFISNPGALLRTTCSTGDINRKSKVHYFEVHSKTCIKHEVIMCEEARPVNEVICVEEALKSKQVRKSIDVFIDTLKGSEKIDTKSTTKQSIETLYNRGIIDSKVREKTLEYVTQAEMHLRRLNKDGE